MINVSVDSFMKNYDKMVNIFEKITLPTSKEEQKTFIDIITTPNSVIKKIHRANPKKQISDNMLS